MEPRPSSDAPRAIGVAQTVPVRGDVDANVEQHLRLIRIAAEERARILVFPELSLTGYELALAAALAFEQADARLAPLLDAASSSSITLIVGAPARLESRLHIGAFIVYPTGATELYTKHHLGAFGPGARRDGTVPSAEATVFQPGNRDPLVRFGEEVGAVAVCADVGPSHSRQAAARGARTYLASMFVIPSEHERETATLRAAATEHGMTVAFANYGGPSGGLAAAGGSAIWSGTGALLGRLGPIGAGVAIATEERGGWSVRTVMLSEGRASASGRRA